MENTILAGFGKALKHDSQNRNPILGVFGPIVWVFGLSRVFRAFLDLKIGFRESGFGAFPKPASLVSFSYLEKNSVLQGLTVYVN